MNRMEYTFSNFEPYMDIPDPNFREYVLCFERFEIPFCTEGDHVRWKVAEDQSRLLVENYGSVTLYFRPYDDTNKKNAHVPTDELTVV